MLARATPCMVRILYSVFSSKCVIYYLISEAYGSAKRQLEILSRSYRKQYGSNFVTLLPTNIMGRKKELRSDGPVVESLIAKAMNAKNSNIPFVCRGSGKPIRQFCYAPGIMMLF